ncbi:MAG: ABC transporter ATP-binding protein [Acidimicrobiales bacterium]
MSRLTVRDLVVSYGHGGSRLVAVDGVDLEVPEGQVVGLVGESGSGKSTLARAVVGLTGLSRGSIELDGRPVRTRGGKTDPLPVQMIFQDPDSSLDPRMTIEDCLSEALERRSYGRGGRRDEVARLLDLVQLSSDVAGRLPRALSGGQRQRVAIARALAATPRVLLADEITSALDVSVQGAILNLIRRLQRQLGFSMLFISHNLAVVRYVSDVIAVMYLGRIVEVAPAEELAEMPKHPYSRALLGALPQLGADTRQDWLALDAEPPDPRQPPSGCRFHPRCPVGPLVLPERRRCVEEDPQAAAAERPHLAACHFAVP